MMVSFLLHTGIGKYDCKNKYLQSIPLILFSVSTKDKFLENSRETLPNSLGFDFLVSMNVLSKALGRLIRKYSGTYAVINSQSVWALSQTIVSTLFSFPVFYTTACSVA